MEGIIAEFQALPRNLPGGTEETHESVSWPRSESGIFQEKSEALPLSIYLSIYLSTYLSIYLSVYLSIYLSIPHFSHLEHRASVKRFVSLQSLNLRQSVGLLGGGINPTQGRYLHRTTQTQNKRRQTSMLSVGFEPTIECLSGRTQFMV
jgi:hypothetical protein